MNNLITDALDFSRIGTSLRGQTGIDWNKYNLFFQGSPGNVSQIINRIVPFLFVIAGLLLLFYLILGGFHMIIASGDEKGLLEAKGKITNALIGFIILFVAYWLVQILEIILGIKVL